MIEWGEWTTDTSRYDADSVADGIGNVIVACGLRAKYRYRGSKSSCARLEVFRFGANNRWLRRLARRRQRGSICRIATDGTAIGRGRISQVSLVSVFKRNHGKMKGPRPSALVSRRLRRGIRVPMGTVLIDKLLHTVVNRKASDLHITVGQPPVVRVDGRLLRLETKVLEPDDTVSLMKSITPERCQQEFQEVGGTDFGFAFGDMARFRVSVFKQRGNVGDGACGRFPTKLMHFEDMGTPPVLKDLIMRPRGLILVTGPTGSGKTTTLAAVVDYINDNVDHHIITIEDPIEFYHKHKKSTDQPARSGRGRAQFRRGHSPRVAAGPGRDPGRRNARLGDDRSGHHGGRNGPHRVRHAAHDRRPGHGQPHHRRVSRRTSRSRSARSCPSAMIGVVSQALLPKIGGGRVAAYEMLVVTPGIANLIRENKTFRITSAIQTGHEARHATAGRPHVPALADRASSRRSEILLKANMPEALAREDRPRPNAACSRTRTKRAARMDEGRQRPRANREPRRITASTDTEATETRHMAIRRIGQVLVDLGFIDDDQLQTLLDEQQQRPGELLGQIAMDMGLITEDQLAQALAEQMGLQVVNLADVTIPQEVLNRSPSRWRSSTASCRSAFDDDTLTVAMCDPQKLCDAGRAADVSGLRHPRGGGDREGRCSRRSSATTPSAARASSR